MVISVLKYPLIVGHVLILNCFPQLNDGVDKLYSQGKKKQTFIRVLPR